MTTRVAVHNVHKKNLETALLATVFHSPFVFSWFGKRPKPLPAKLRRALTTEAARNYVRTTLQEHLYSNFYCKGFASPLRWEVSQPQYNAQPTPLLEELSKANSGIGYWSSGWEVRIAEDDRIVVSNGGLALKVLPEDCLTPDGTAITPGLSIKVHLPKEFAGISPGYYLAAGDTELTKSDWQQVVRIYWNVTPKGAIQLMRRITASFNQKGLPFRLKILKDLARTMRCDAAVLYLRKSDYPQAREILEKLYSEIVGDLRRGTPVLTKSIAGEVGAAEEPSKGLSFGQHRCELLAEAIVSAYEQGEKSIDARMQIVENRFAAEGIDLSNPYLNSGSADIYGFEPRQRRVFPVMGPPSMNSRIASANTLLSRSQPKRFLNMARSIGSRLCREAIWCGNRCNWVGASPKDLEHRTFGALGAELYSGTSGVGLFLAEIAAITGDKQMRETAFGAIRQAFSNLESVTPSLRLGFYSGWPGIALAADHIAKLFNDEELTMLSRSLIRRVIGERRSDTQLDLMSGNTGAIVALISLRHLFDDQSLLDFCVVLGDELLTKAVKLEDGYSWKTINNVDEFHLTGLSHGTAGMGYALLELFHATGDPRYSHAAVMAFEYERCWFDASVGNWPDLREAKTQNKRTKHPLAYSTYWCHGAPGIALSRLRAFQILRDEHYREEAMTGLNTTRTTIEDELYSRNTNFSLCHGLAGNADVLLVGSEILGPAFAVGAEKAREVGDAGLEMYAASGHGWPCGTAGGTTPSLMLGLAGIGYFYLRLCSPTVRSILIMSETELPNVAQMRSAANGNFRTVGR